MIPPKFAATNDSTRTPNRSSRRLNPAAAPLSAKTKVPHRSSTRTSVLTVTYRESSLIRLRGQPGLGRDDECLHTRLQRRVDHRSKAWIVIRRQLAEPAFRPRFRVQIGIRSADEPEHRWRFPLRAERSEVFARR